MWPGRRPAGGWSWSLATGRSPACPSGPIPWSFTRGCDSAGARPTWGSSLWPASASKPQREGAPGAPSLCVPGMVCLAGLLRRAGARLRAGDDDRLALLVVVERLDAVLLAVAALLEAAER